MYFVRRTYRLEDYIGPEHFDKMGKLLVVTTLSLAYLYFADQFTVWYGRIPDHMAVLHALMVSGVYAVPLWTMIALIYVVPLCYTLTLPAFRPWPVGMHADRALHQLGMYIERMLIVVPPLARPRLTVQLDQLFPLLGGADHPRGIVRPGGPALCTGRQIRADHFHLGGKGRTLARL